MAALVTLTEELTEAILAQYGEISKLNLSNNGLQSIENIVKLSTLEKLTLRCNDLIDVRPLGVLTSLKELDLADNRIMDASPLATLDQLETLDISNNGLSHVVSSACLRYASAPRLFYSSLSFPPV
jgi:Leucine-rich repeat (LRR) protein